MALGWLAAGTPLVGHAEPPRTKCSKNAPCTIAPAAPPAQDQASSGSYALAFSGNAVNFDLSGLEPDFDPIYKVAVTGTLHDLRAAGRALPDAMLVLSAYLEAFQPDTTPVLPDLLHPNQVATDLGGFLTGKAALVNRGGRTVYRGDLLSEIFQDSSEHLVVDLYPVGAAPDAPFIRLQGVITLHKGGAENGTLRALQPLATAALNVRTGRRPTWQAVIAGLTVEVPAMLGTAGSPGQTGAGATVAPVDNMGGTTGSSLETWRFAAPLAGAGVLTVLGGLLLGWRIKRRARAKAPEATTAAPEDSSGDETEPAG
jgi:hypothetical protein